MKYMNDYDLQRSRALFTRAAKPNRLAAVMVIDNLREWADANSDGWSYWPKPVRAASGLMDLCYPQTNADDDRMSAVDATDAELAAAVRPVKAFLTREKVRSQDREIILRSVTE